MSYFEPALSVLLLLAVVGLVRAWRKSSRGHKPRLLVFSIVAIFLLSSDFVVWLCSRPLEAGYEEREFPNGSAEAIVVLSGFVDSPAPNRPYPLAGHDTYVRIEYAAWLFKHWAHLPVLACGGGEDSESYSQTMRHLLESEGIPPNMIWTEERSRSTHENAVYGSIILKQHGISRIALVTDARSMFRAAASFRKQELSVVPAPLAFYDFPESSRAFLPDWQAIQSNGETVHEVVGWIWYWFHDWV